MANEANIFILGRDIYINTIIEKFATAVNVTVAEAGLNGRLRKVLIEGVCLQNHLRYPEQWQNLGDGVLALPTKFDKVFDL